MPGLIFFLDRACTLYRGGSNNNSLALAHDDEDSALAPKFIFTSTDLEVVEGSQVRVNCRLTGRPAPEVKWFLNGQPRCSDQRNRIMVNETGYNTLLILDTKLSDSGVVQCWAKNRSGEARFQVKAD